jgi:DNA mismatch repair protein MutS2
MTVVRRSYLRRRSEGGPDLRQRQGRKTGGQPSGLFGRAVQLVLTGSAAGREPIGELDGLAMPDLLDPAPTTSPDPEELLNLLELAFLGRVSSGELDRELDALPGGRTDWVRDHFADDLFVGELVRTCFQIRIASRRLPIHRRFIERVLMMPPAELDVVLARQAALRELETEPDVRSAAREVLVRTSALLSLLRASRDDARLEPVRFRLDVLRSFREVVDLMADGFAGSRSILRRLHDFGSRVRDTGSFGRMVALLDHESGMATLQLEAVVGASGRLRHLEIRGIREGRRNPFYRGPVRRWWDRLRMLSRSYRITSDELVDRLVMGIFAEVAPAIARVLQASCHLEVYLASADFAELARSRGLSTCLPSVETGASLRLDRLFNPLLIPLMDRPVPADVELPRETPVTLVTGPNSGGKTRLLQAVGLAQMLGQSGLYVPCSGGRLPLVSSLFASIVEVDRADQSEGRLGTEMMRLRTLFETVPPGSLVLLDELCSGTNPSEAIEIVSMVLALLGRLRPVALVTTHFLDFAHDLHASRSDDGLGFLQAEVSADGAATYRFVPGVASTSLAVGTARRLGVAFDDLERRLAERVGPAVDPSVDRS